MKPVLQLDPMEDMRQRLLRDEEVQSMIAMRAYEIYVSRGADPGKETEDWFQAENEIIGFLIAEELGKGLELVESKPVIGKKPAITSPSRVQRKTALNPELGALAQPAPAQDLATVSVPDKLVPKAKPSKVKPSEVKADKPKGARADKNVVSGKTAAAVKDKGTSAEPTPPKKASGKKMAPAQAPAKGSTASAKKGTGSRKTPEPR
jgi:hypothetical protein